MKKIEAKELLAKYEAGKCNEQEQALLESWHLSYALDAVENIGFDEQSKDLDQVWNKLQKQTKPVTIKVALWPKMVAAAAIFLILGIAVFFYLQQINPFQQTTKLASDLPPGKNNAVLTLSNGQKIILNETAKGEIAKQGGVSITKSQDGTIIYNIDQSATDIKAQAGELSYNTITTPRGGQYQVNLPDGTKVWLNAASSLKFPTTFTDLKERKVELSGEAYFEVAKNKRQPFHVKTVQQDLEVLGTHFNVNAYSDEKEIKTTLLEGSVKIVPLSQSKAKMPLDVVLKPGQQATLMESRLNIGNADIGEVMSWKNGMFEFNNSDLTSIMRQASRWYDVDVVYESGIPNVKFSGEVSRNVNASAFLGMLKYLDVKFNIEKTGNNRSRIVVSK
ncbi:MAG: FecR domain-containing protein [Candidatus Pedobacter colombiensis]|uniref:FecR domain-containing protein n=1 Tax=Candidatus Pedobacter colombiensis TaxID=3121371 RepID=A0AAJ5WA48_9SPHI|nr:FecR family protein [Pedobacter sp.]WEK20570.1 MAG: FecR domain-containing protein [Pedobacter sp.]